MSRWIESKLVKATLFGLVASALLGCGGPAPGSAPMPDPCFIHPADLAGEFTDVQANEWFEECGLDSADALVLANLFALDRPANYEEINQATERLSLIARTVAIHAEKLVDIIEGNSTSLGLTENSGLAQTLGRESVDSLEELNLLSEADTNPIDLAALLYHYEAGQLGIVDSEARVLIGEMTQLHLAQLRTYAWLIKQGDESKKDNAATSALNTIVFAELHARLSAGQPQYLGEQVLAHQAFSEAMDLISQTNRVLAGLDDPFQRRWQADYSRLIDEAAGLTDEASVQEFLNNRAYLTRLGFLDYTAAQASGLESEKLDELSQSYAAMLNAQHQELSEQVHFGNVRLNPTILDEARVGVGKHVLKVTFPDGSISEHSLDEPNFSLADVITELAGGREGITFGEGLSLKLVTVDHLGVFRGPDGKNHLGARLDNVFYQGNFYHGAIVLLDYSAHQLELNNSSVIDFDLVPPAKDQEVIYLFNGQLPEGWQEISFWTERPQAMIGGSSLEEVLLVLAEADQEPWAKQGIALSMGDLIRPGIRTQYAHYQKMEMVNPTPLLRVKVNSLGIITELEELAINLEPGTRLPVFPQEHGWRDTSPLNLVPGAQRGDPDEAGTVVFVGQVGEDEFLAVWAREVKIENVFSRLSWYYAVFPQHVWAEIGKLFPSPLRIGGTVSNPLEGVGGTVVDEATGLKLWEYLAVEKMVAKETIEAYETGALIWAPVREAAIPDFELPHGLWAFSHYWEYGWRSVTQGEYAAAVDNLTFLNSLNRTRVYLPWGRPLYLGTRVNQKDVAGALGGGSFLGTLSSGSTVLQGHLVVNRLLDTLYHPILPSSAPYAGEYTQPDPDDPSVVFVP